MSRHAVQTIRRKFHSCSIEAQSLFPAFGKSVAGILEDVAVCAGPPPTPQVVFILGSELGFIISVCLYYVYIIKLKHLTQSSRTAQDGRLSWR